MIKPVTATGLSSTVSDTYMTRYDGAVQPGDGERFSDLITAPGALGIGCGTA